MVIVDATRVAAPLLDPDPAVGEAPEPDVREEEPEGVEVELGKTVSEAAEA